MSDVKTLNDFCIDEGLVTYDVENFIENYNTELSNEQIEILNHISKNQNLLKF